MKASRERNLSAWGLKPEIRERENERLKKMPVEALRYQAGQAQKVQMALAGVAQITGGWADFLEDPSQADAVYSRIFSDINSRYIIGYYPTNKEHDGKRRTLNIEVRGHPEYVVWGKKSYYVPGQDQ